MYKQKYTYFLKKIETFFLTINYLEKKEYKHIQIL